MMLITALSLLIVIVVVFIVHTGKDDEMESIPITPDSAAIGAWSTDLPEAAGGDAAGGSAKTMNDVALELTENGHAEGTFGKYEFEGTWQQVSKFRIRLVNNKGKAVYEAVIDPDDEDAERPSMELAATDVTDSMTWTLYKR